MDISKHEKYVINLIDKHGAIGFVNIERKIKYVKNHEKSYNNFFTYCVHNRLLHALNHIVTKYKKTTNQYFDYERSANTDGDLIKIFMDCHTMNGSYTIMFYLTQNLLKAIIANDNKQINLLLTLLTNITKLDVNYYVSIAVSKFRLHLVIHDLMWLLLKVKQNTSKLMHNLSSPTKHNMSYWSIVFKDMLDMDGIIENHLFNLLHFDSININMSIYLLDLPHDYVVHNMNSDEYIEIILRMSEHIELHILTKVFDKIINKFENKTFLDCLSIGGFYIYEKEMSILNNISRLKSLKTRVIDHVSKKIHSADIFTLLVLLSDDYMKIA